MSLQSVLVILTLARWMAIAADVPRIGTIVRTLRQATTVLTELALVFLMIGLPIGISLIMTVGSRVEAFSSPHKMLQQLGEESIACAIPVPPVPAMLPLISLSSHSGACMSHPPHAACVVNADCLRRREEEEWSSR